MGRGWVSRAAFGALDCLDELGWVSRAAFGALDCLDEVGCLALPSARSIFWMRLGDSRCLRRARFFG